MIRLHIIAEGQTEQNFVKQVLAPHLADFRVTAYASCILTSRSKGARGGLLSYTHCRFTTMFDLYALPDDFPEYVTAARQSDPYQRIRLLEEGMGRDIDDRRFIPYIQLHEFEALILADPQKLALEYLEHDEPIRNLVALTDARNPEEINDGRETAPARRILKEIPEYSKVTSGAAVAKEIGLPTLRSRCRHFGEWLSCLEQLAS